MGRPRRDGREGHHREEHGKLASPPSGRHPV
jgi:hypothetical protein